MSRFGFSPFLLVLAFAATGCARQAPMAEAPKQAIGPAAVTVGQELGAAVRNQLQISFASGSDRLMPDATKNLDIAVRLFRDVRPVMMFSVGYTDAAGNEFDNLVLSARRARTVKAALVARGIPANQIALRAYGQSDPIDKANPSDPANRRVLVTWDIM